MDFKSRYNDEKASLDQTTIAGNKKYLKYCKNIKIEENRHFNRHFFEKIDFFGFFQKNAY